MTTVITWWRSGFHVIPIHQGFVVDKLALGQFFLHTFWLTLSLFFHKCSISVYLLIHLVTYVALDTSITDPYSYFIHLPPVKYNLSTSQC